MRKLFTIGIAVFLFALLNAQPTNPCRACFPNSNGHSGEFLQTNGFGGLSWAAAGGGGSSFNRDSVLKYAWGLSGNSGTAAGTNFIGTIDAQSIVFKTKNTSAWSIDTFGMLLPATNNTKGIGSESLAVNSIYVNNLRSDLFKFKDFSDHTVITIENAAKFITFDVDTPRFNLPIYVSDGTQNYGYVLTTDATGLASWQPSAAATFEQGLTNGGLGGGYNRGDMKIQSNGYGTFFSDDTTFAAFGYALGFGNLSGIGFGDSSIVGFAENRLFWQGNRLQLRGKSTAVLFGDDTVAVVSANLGFLSAQNGFYVSGDFLNRNTDDGGLFKTIVSKGKLYHENAAADSITTFAADEKGVGWITETPNGNLSFGTTFGNHSFGEYNASNGVNTYFTLPHSYAAVQGAVLTMLDTVTGQATWENPNSLITGFLPLAGGTMDGGSHIYFGSGGQNISQGTFDNGTGGNNGISLNCAIGYELNWQGGHLSSSYNSGANFTPIIIDSLLRLTGLSGNGDGLVGVDDNGLLSWQRVDSIGHDTQKIICDIANRNIAIFSDSQLVMGVVNTSCSPWIPYAQFLPASFKMGITDAIGGGRTFFADTVRGIGWQYSSGDDFSLPVIDGTAGQALVTNGSGVIGFQSVSASVAYADSTGLSAADANVTSYTPTSTGTYRIGGYLTVTAISANVLNLTVTYTDETSTPRTQTFAVMGTTSPSISATGAFTFADIQIRAKSGNVITVATTATGIGSQTYDVGATIEKLR